MRSGREYTESLRDGRKVFLDGEAVGDVTTHPAFAATVGVVARLYDLARERPEVMSYPSPDTGRPANRCWMVPRSADDLRARDGAHRLWQEETYGLLGRSPDHVASFLTGFVASRDIFARGGEQFAVNVERFHRRAREEDLYLAYAIVPPQGDRSKPAHLQPDPHLYAGVVAERDGGIVVRGAQGVATAAVLADWLLLSSIVPLAPGDEDYALSLVLPLASPGLRIYPRRPYATVATGVFDYPLSSRYDETDALIVLDDVFVPWEHVFVYRDRALCQAQFFEGPAHVLGNLQALVRLAVKLRFLAGLARRIAELNGTAGQPAAQARLAELAAHAAAVEALVRSAEVARIDASGVARPDVEAVYAALVLQPGIWTAVLPVFRELVGGSPIAMPSSEAMFASPATGEDVRRFYAAGRTGAEERVKLLRLAWDLTGTEFGGRQLQYETFYAGAPHLVRLRTERAFDWSRATDLVDRCLASYGGPGEAPGGAPGEASGGASGGAPGGAPGDGALGGGAVPAE